MNHDFPHAEVFRNLAAVLRAGPAEGGENVLGQVESFHLSEVADRAAHGLVGYLRRAKKKRGAFLMEQGGGEERVSQTNTYFFVVVLGLVFSSSSRLARFASLAHFQKSIGYLGDGGVCSTKIRVLQQGRKRLLGPSSVQSLALALAKNLGEIGRDHAAQNDVGVRD